MRNEQKYKIVTANLEKCFYCSYLICQKVESLENLELNGLADDQEYMKIQKELKILLQNEEPQYKFLNQKDLKEYLFDLYKRDVIDDLLQFHAFDELSEKAVGRTSLNIGMKISLYSECLIEGEPELVDFCSPAQLKTLLGLKRKIYLLNVFVVREFNKFFISELNKLIEKINPKTIKEQLIKVKYSYLSVFDNLDFDNLLNENERNKLNSFENKYKSEINKAREGFIRIELKKLVDKFLYNREYTFEDIDNTVNTLDDYARLKAFIKMMTNREKSEYLNSILGIIDRINFNVTGKGMLLLAFSNEEEISSPFELILK